MSLDLKPEHLQLVKVILARQIPTHLAWAFGSRVNGTAQPFSDLDICVSASAPMSYEEKANLRLAFSESNLAFMVDIVDLKRCSASFIQHIDLTKSPLS